MKPTTPYDREMVFLRDVESRLNHLHTRISKGYSGVPEVLGLQSVVQCRISEVTRQQEENYAAEGGPMQPLRSNVPTK